MVFKPLVFTDKINLSSDLIKKTAGSKLMDLIKPYIDEIIHEVIHHTFEYDSFSFEKNFINIVS
jgi:hypothetical protein